MKKLIIFILFLLVFSFSAPATVYKWVDQGGTVNFVDDYSKVPPDYRNSVEEVRPRRMNPPTPFQAPLEKAGVSAQSGGTATKPPPIAQALVREGDFAIKLAETLKIGSAKSEAEAENMLASIGVSPKNGWIADYPVTPDIIGELQNAIATAADSGNLAMNKDQAMKALQDLTTQQGLPVRAGAETQYAGVEPPPRDYGEYSNPTVINNYYYDQGPPVVTYYPPPWDYYYMYAWVPYPFWCSGFWFPGFFCLRDFHRGFFFHGQRKFVSNHFWDSRTRGFGTIDPAMRGTGKLPHPGADVSRRGGFDSSEAKRGAASIVERSRERAKPGYSIASGARSAPARHVPLNRSSISSSFGGRAGAVRPSLTNYWMGRSRTGIVPRNIGGRPFSHQGGFGNRTGASFGSSMGGRSFGGFHGGGFGSRGSIGGGSAGHRAR